MSPWRVGDCGHLHDWGLCTGEHQVQDTEDVFRRWFPDGNPTTADPKSLEGDSAPVPSRLDLIVLLRGHALSTVLEDGKVICKCGYVCQPVWFTEHLVEKVGRGF